MKTISTLAFILLNTLVILAFGYFDVHPIFYFLFGSFSGVTQIATLDFIEAKKRGEV